MNAPEPVRVAREKNLSHDAFIQEYLLPLRPVILTDATAHWAALTKWTPSFFRDQYGTTLLTIDGRQHSMADFIELVLGSTPEHPAPYLHNHLLKKWMPELLTDIFPLPYCTSPNWLESRLFPSKQSHTYVELYIGGKGARFPTIHYDNWHTHAFLMQIYGVKEYVIYAPDQAPMLYPKAPGSNVSLINDVKNPDLEKFSLFADANPGYCYLYPGETLFVPAGWWHTARIISTSITVSANTANAANWHEFVSDYCGSTTGTWPRPFRYAFEAYLLALKILSPLLD